MAMDIRVAIFEDNQLFREAMQAILNGTPGYMCCGAFGDSYQLLARVERSRPDVILMDIEMPGISGIEACLLRIARYLLARHRLQMLPLPSSPDPDRLQ